MAEENLVYILERTIATITKQKQTWSELWREYFRCHLVHYLRKVLDPLQADFVFGREDIIVLTLWIVAINLTCVKTSKFRRNNRCVCNVYVSPNYLHANSTCKKISMISVRWDQLNYLFQRAKTWKNCPGWWVK